MEKIIKNANLQVAIFPVFRAGQAASSHVKNLSRPIFQLIAFWMAGCHITFHFYFILKKVFCIKYAFFVRKKRVGKRVQSPTHHCRLRDENFKACLSYSIKYNLCHYVTSHHMAKDLKNISVLLNELDKLLG